MTPEEYRDKTLKDYCHKCGEKNDCHGEHCVFWEYKEKEAKDENKTSVNI